jgi:hypothetical protein
MCAGAGKTSGARDQGAGHAEDRGHKGEDADADRTEKVVAGPGAGRQARFSHTPRGGRKETVAHHHGRGKPSSDLIPSRRALHRPTCSFHDVIKSRRISLDVRYDCAGRFPSVFGLPIQRMGSNCFCFSTFGSFRFMKFDMSFERATDFVAFDIFRVTRRI